MYLAVWQPFSEEGNPFVSSSCDWGHMEHTGHTQYMSYLIGNERAFEIRWEQAICSWKRAYFARWDA